MNTSNHIQSSINDIRELVSHIANLDRDSSPDALQKSFEIVETALSDAEYFLIRALDELNSIDPSLVDPE